MQKKIRTLATVFVLLVVGVACFALLGGRASAEVYSAYEDHTGEGWSTTTDGVLTIESDQGWANFLKQVHGEYVSQLIIGKDVARFRMYNLPNDLPSPDFFDSFEAVGYDKDGAPIYEYMYLQENLFPSKITIEEGNGVFCMVDGMLINTETNAVVLAEMGVEEAVIPEGIKVINRRAFY